MLRRLPAIVLGGALVIAAFSTGADFLFFLLYLGLLVVGGSYLVTRFGLADLEAGYALDRLNGQVGEALRVTYTIRNAGRLPKLWLEAFNPSTLPVPLPGRALVLGPRAERSWAARVPLVARGHFRVDPLVIRTGDPFGLFEASAMVGSGAGVTIYPRVEPLPRWRLPASTLEGTSATPERTSQATPLVTSIRPYAPGDAYNRIHWKSSARHQELQVKEFDLEQTADLWIYLAHGAVLEHGLGGQRRGGAHARLERGLVTLAGLHAAIEVEVDPQVGRLLEIELLDLKLLVTGRALPVDAVVGVARCVGADGGDERRGLRRALGGRAGALQRACREAPAWQRLDPGIDRHARPAPHHRRGLEQPERIPGADDQRVDAEVAARDERHACRPGSLRAGTQDQRPTRQRHGQRGGVEGLQPELGEAAGVADRVGHPPRLSDLAVEPVERVTGLQVGQPEAGHQVAAAHHEQAQVEEEEEEVGAGRECGDDQRPAEHDGRQPSQHGARPAAQAGRTLGRSGPAGWDSIGTVSSSSRTVAPASTSRIVAAVLMIRRGDSAGSATGLTSSGMAESRSQENTSGL